MGAPVGWIRWPAAAVAAVALAWPAVASADDEVDADPDVQEAREEAERAREEAREAEQALEEQRMVLEAISADLDQAAEAYEHADAHHRRLVDEADESRARTDAASAASDQARQSFADQINALYRHGPLELRLSRLVLEADSPSSALHRVGWLERLSAASQRRLAGAERVAGRTADDARQHQVVTAGTEAAAAEVRRRRDDLDLATQTAEGRVATARESLVDAEAEIERADADVEEAVETAQRRLAWEQRDWVDPEDADARGRRMPSVDGKVCPIGSPNGFSDSWGAPRSGGRRHQGVDMFAVRGMPLYAVADGTVRVSNNRLGGLVVHLDADDGDRYYYAHLDAVSVSTGERVGAGDVVGANGDSGNARGTPPHLHWQYHPGGGAAVNPYPLARELCR